MRIRILSILALVLMACSIAGSPAWAVTSKLDARARVALAQLRAGADPREMIQLTGAAVSESGDLDVFIEGSVSRADLEAAGAVVRTELPNGIFTAFVPVDAIEAVEALPGVARISGAVQCETNLNAAVPTTRADIQRLAGPTFAGANGAGVLVGDIDTGVTVTHDDFRTAAGTTRFLRIWDQTYTGGTPPAGYSYGSEYLPAAINGGTAQGKDLNGHGSHVMGIIAGDGSGTGGSVPAFTYTGMAPMADMVAIKSNLNNTQIVDALAYFFGLATSFGQNAVMNMSFGSLYGPHDGTSAFESGITALTGPGRIVTVSAGNNGNSGLHAGVNAVVPNPAVVTLAASGAASGRIIGINGYYEATETINVTLTGPGSFGTFGPITLGGINAPYPGQQFGTGTTKGYVYIENGAYLTATNAREVYIEIRSGTTGSFFNGTWTLTFTPVANGAANGRVDLWRFYTSNTAVGATFVTGREDARLVGEPGCATGVITCGAWITKTSWTNCAGLNISYSATTPPTLVDYIAPFSSNGPTRDGRLKPDIAAPGQGIGSTRSLDITLGACNTTSTYYSYLNDNMMHVINQGTSMAAPHVAGACALLMQKFGPLTRTQILAKLNALALVDAYTGAVPNNTWGAGKLRVDVTDPVVTVNYPNGGEILYVSSSQNLTWNASDPVWSGVASVDLHLSRDGGATWVPLASGIPNSGTFPWTVTNPPTTNALFRVTAHDVADNQAADVSNAQFTIANPPVPVELSLFVAEPTDAGVKISWKYADPSMFVSAFVERAPSADGPWVRLDVPVATSAAGLSVVDETGEAGLTYFYRLQAAGRGGETSIFGPISATAGRPITEFLLLPAWPNPTRGLARVDFAVPRPAHVSLKVFDIQGRVVATLTDRDYAPGRYQTAWDGTTASGGPAASGVYFIHLLTPSETFVQKVTLSR